MSWLPVIVILAFVGARTRAASQQSIRMAFWEALLLIGVFIAVTSELLSFYHLLNAETVTIAWVVLAATCLLFWRVLGIRAGASWPLGQTKQTYAHFVTFIAIAVLVCAVFAVAHLAPPNTYDALTYHMPRVMHWLRRESLDYFPTNIPRQDYQSPWSSTALLHLYSLAGSDSTSNCLQAVCFVGCVVAVSLIVQASGASAKVQCAAALLAASMPGAVLEGSGTQNNLSTSLWVLVFAFSVLTWSTKPRVFLAGASLGLALLTKQTAYIACAPFIAFWLIRVSRTPAARAQIHRIAATALLVVVLNAPHWDRNIRYFGNPLGATEDATVARRIRFGNEALGLRSAASNIVRNAALHFVLPSDVLTHALQRSVEMGHRVFGVDPHDERTTWPGQPFRLNPLSRDEDHPANLLHSVLGLF